MGACPEGFMKQIFILTFCAVCCLWNPALGDQSEVHDNGLQYQKIVTEMGDLTANLADPLKVFAEKNAHGDGKFDPARYFTVLQNISLPEGKLLDYFYCLQGSAGYPVLYLRGKHQRPYSGREEYSKSPEHSKENRENMMDNIVKHLEVKDTQGGYFEYVVFYLMAPRFYLWKWAKTDHEIICHETRLFDRLSSEPHVPAEVAAAAKKLSLSPQINLSPERAEVKIITFTAWGGFFEERFIISRSSPHTLLDHTKQCLVEYNCGIRF